VEKIFILELENDADVDWNLVIDLMMTTHFWYLQHMSHVWRIKMTALWISVVLHR